MAKSEGTKQLRAGRRSAAGRQTSRRRSVEPALPVAEPAAPVAAAGMVDLDRMTAQELVALIDAARLKLDEKMRDAKEALINEMKVRAAALGFTLSEIIPGYGRSPGTMVGKARRTQAGKPEAKYRDPGTGQTWSGRGRQPHWMRGKDRESFLIKGQGEAGQGETG